MTDDEWEWLRRIKSEDEWRSCESPQPLLTYLKSKTSSRKFRLYAAACARRIWSHLSYRESRQSVEVAERFADGQANAKERAAAEEAADDIVDVIVDEEAGDTAYHAALAAAWCARSFSRDPDSDSGHAAFYAATTVGDKAPFLALVHCVFGNPFHPVTAKRTWLTWNDGAVRRVAQAIYDERAFDRMPVLADALEDAGCNDEHILSHCRSAGSHARGCHVLDALLGKK
jgi:hypothetical protein